MAPKVIIQSPEELPPVPCSMGGMDWNPTGLWRYLAPAPRDKTAPCAAACPAGNPIPQLMADLAAERPDRALARLLAVNPLPGVTGRLCYHPCQRDCLRGQVDRSLPVQALERWAADQGKAPKPAAKGRGPRVAVLGAGPLGLTAAYHLGRAGLRVSLFDPLDRPGGFLLGVDGLPDSVLRLETTRLATAANLELSLGQAPDPNLLAGADLVLVDPTAHAASSSPGKALAAWSRRLAEEVVVRPDLEPGFKGFKPVRVAHAVGMGRELAERALARLEGRAPSPPAAAEVVGAGEMRLARFAPEKPARKAPARLGPERAAYEAGRCMSCGTCNLCQQCILFCPDGCLSLETGKGLPRVDLDHCKGCGVCAQECPRGVIAMEDEA